MRKKKNSFERFSNLATAATGSHYHRYPDHSYMGGHRAGI